MFYEFLNPVRIHDHGIHTKYGGVSFPSYNVYENLHEKYKNDSNVQVTLKLLFRSYTFYNFNSKKPYVDFVIKDFDNFKDAFNWHYNNVISQYIVWC